MATAARKDMSKAPPAHTKGEIQRYVDLGLGRGVDGTDPTPWLNKTSFQVRKVKYENIVGTDEGGAVQSYQREVSSVRSQQTKVKSSITMPHSPVSIGADAEVFRSLHSSRRLMGRKVVNRTISFCDKLEDVPLGESPITDDHRKLQSFEEHLSEWIINRLRNSRHSHALEEQSESQPSAKGGCGPLNEIAHIIEENSQEEMQFIADACTKFIEHFRITHYVSCIFLGAAEYLVMTQEDYELSVSVSTKAGVKGIAGSSAQQDVSTKQKTKSAEHKRIGVMNEERKVLRGSDGEVVIDVHIRPITTLIRNAFLYSCMQKALLNYVEEKRDKSAGPFLIYCGVGKSILYLQVDHTNNYAVIATRDRKKASEFFIVTTDDKSGENNFYIMFYEHEDEADKADKLEQKYPVLSTPHHDSKGGVALYLDCPVSWWGENPGPLYVRDTVPENTSRFALKSRIVSDKGVKSLALDSWVKGWEMYYIIGSPGGFFRPEGCLAVKKQKDQSYVTACTSCTHYHDNSNFFMLFRLLPQQDTVKIV